MEGDRVNPPMTIALFTSLSPPIILLRAIISRSQRADWHRNEARINADSSPSQSGLCQTCWPDMSWYQVGHWKKFLLQKTSWVVDSASSEVFKNCQDLALRYWSLGMVWWTEGLVILMGPIQPEWFCDMTMSTQPHYHKEEMPIKHSKHYKSMYWKERFCQKKPYPNT